MHSSAAGTSARIVLRSPSSSARLRGLTVARYASMAGSRFISAPVRMIGTGWVGSAATHLFLSVPKERRFCLPQTRFLIHQPSGGAGGQATDIAIMAREIIKARERIASVIARETGQKLEKVLVDIERDNWMGPQEAIEYGLISRIIENRKDLG